MITSIQNTPFLRDQRDFPTSDVQELSVELDKAYVDVSNAVNSRTIGIYPTNVPVNTGETFFLAGQANRQRSLRQVYAFTSTTSITHNIPFAELTSFKTAYGTYTDNTNWYGCIFASNVAIAGQITFYITPTHIVFASGAGAPTLTSGLIVLEWISVV